jgi:hypothetical protein
MVVEMMTESLPILFFPMGMPTLSLWNAGGLGGL